MGVPFTNLNSTLLVCKLSKAPSHVSLSVRYQVAGTIPSKKCISTWLMGGTACVFEEHKVFMSPVALFCTVVEAPGLHSFWTHW